MTTTETTPIATLSQWERVLAHLQESGSITHAEARIVHQIPRLAARICELRQAGFDIVSELRTDEAGTRYTRYVLRV